MRRIAVEIRPLSRPELPIPATRLARHRPDSPLRDMARGPGRLATALAITRDLDGRDLCAGPGALWLGDAVKPRGRIAASARIGISREMHRPLRFFEEGNPHVSGP